MNIERYNRIRSAQHILSIFTTLENVEKLPFYAGK